MIDPKEYGAIAIGTLPLELTRVQVLEAFETPLIIQLENPKKEPFLQYWCDRETDIDRWIVLRTSIPDLTKYLAGATTTRSLILEGQEFVFLLDTKRGKSHDAFLMRTDALPEDYVPTENSYSDQSTQINPDEQSIFIDEVEQEDDQWGYRRVSEYPRKFLQAYSFHALFGRNGNAHGLGTIRYTLNGGYVFYQLFTRFGAHVAEDKRAQLIGVSYASPGYMRFKVNRSIAADLRDGISQCLEETTQVKLAALEQFARHPDDDIPERIVRRLLKDFCEGIKIDYDEFVRHFDGIPAAIKAMASYVRRLEFLAEKDKNKSAMMVGLKR